MFHGEGEEIIPQRLACLSNLEVISREKKKKLI